MMATVIERNDLLWPLKQMVASKLADIAARKALGEKFKPAKRRDGRPGSTEPPHLARH